jgi:hypothetical protein
MKHVSALSRISAVLLPLALAACVQLTSQEKVALDRAKASGMPVPREVLVDPGTAGALNLLPGIGNMYIGANTEEKTQWVYGALNLLFWPLSILWGIPEAAIDAKTINEKYTAQYYLYGEGKAALDAAEAKGKP